MGKKKKRIKKRNGIAKALESRTHQQKIIPNKKRKAKNNPTEEDMRYIKDSITSIIDREFRKVMQ